MVIKFICPNGHQLSAPDDRAGKMGKCPKCHTAFVVPGLDDDEDAGDESQPGDGAAHPGQANGGPQSVDAGEEMIVFLCPNGHKLNGPAKLKGRPGQCPHCNARFVVPDDDEDEPTPEPEQVPVEEEPQVVPEPAASPQVGPPVDAPTGPPPPPSPASDPPASIAPVGHPPTAAGMDDALTPPQPVDGEVFVVDAAEVVEELPSVEILEQVDFDTGHPLNALVGRLFDPNSGVGHLELELNDGKVILANRFSGALSLGEFGVFAHESADDDADSSGEAGDGGPAADVTIVAWDNIRRITVRRPNGLPEDLF